jgi:hypothetical protein
MSNPEQTQEQIELETIEINHHLEMGEALLRLEQNPDFKKVILDGYFREKALASVSLLAVPQIKQQGQRPDIMEDLVATSNLQYFFQTIHNFYQGAKAPILSDEEEQELQAAEEAANIEAAGGTH